MDTTCFICKKGASAGKVLTFTDESLKKCKRYLELRVEFKFVYSDCILPADLASATESGYHVSCYRKFSAVSAKKQHAPTATSPDRLSDPPSLRSQSTSLPTTSTGVLPKLCVFCHHERKKVSQKEQSLIQASTSNIEVAVKHIATIKRDYELLAKVGDDFSAKEVHYHNICWLKYSSQVSGVKSKQSSEKEAGFNEVMSEMLMFIETNIVVKKQVYMLLTLHKRFLVLYNEIVGDDQCSYSPQSLERKISKHFQETLVISKLQNKGQNKVVHHRDLTSHQLQLLIASTNEQVLFAEVASKLRKIICNIDSTPLPSVITAADVLKGEVEIPSLLLEFLTVLIGGSKSADAHSDSTKRRVKSIAEDIIFACMNGKFKPSKHISLGLSMMGLTSCRKVINILNRFGHTLSYSTLQAIETELCYSDVEISNSTLAPSAMTKSPHLATGVAFDNFDRFVETVNGKDTLHDTVGISYQIFSRQPDHSFSFSSDKLAESGPPKKRRRKFEIEKNLIEPYRKKPKIAQILEPVDHPGRSCVPTSLSLARNRDLVWMISIANNLPHIPMWVGYNAKTVLDSSPVQKVFYLPPINQSPTSASVVQETMKQAQRIAAECGQKSIFVTYDLAIAKVAYQIQSSEAPKFDNLFINMGAFHVQMAFFNAVGKIIENCGLTDIMIDANVIASGSVYGFIKGKHFNRCKRIHPIVSLSLQILHFKRFLQLKDINISTQILSELEILSKTRGNLVLSSEMAALLNEYEQFCNETLDGLHGKTAKFYFNYVNMINYFHMYSRSIREGDFQLYLHIIPKLTSIFFAMNQPNYARWSVVYHNNLMKIEQTHPDLVPSIELGCFAIKRTAGNFTRSPIDLTLEQTINADAANKLTGISYFTNSISARERWARSHSIKAEIISATLENAGLKAGNDVNAELKPSRVKHDNETVRRLTESIKKHIDPFDATVHDEELFNIATGKKVREDVAKCLLNVEMIGTNARNEFISACSRDPSRIEQPIKKQKMLTFVDEQKKLTRKTQDSKLADEINCKNLFARMLAVSTEQKVDIAEVLKYPLTLTPRAFSYADGSLMKTDKSTLMQHLAKIVPIHSPPNSVDVVLIDGFFLLHTISDIPRTFGLISRKFLQMLTHNKAKQIFVIFDQYFKPSIKDRERNRRGECIQNESYIIIGPDQLKPNNFMNCLRSDEFKKNFVRFLSNHWQDHSLNPFFQNKQVFLNFENQCYEFSSCNNLVSRNSRDEYSCNHEEADTRFIFIVSKLEDQKNVVIRCNDTDVLVILLGNLSKISCSIKIWMEIGLFTNNTLRYLNIHELSVKLGDSVCQALPGFHAFTGCDTTSSFFRKGKITPFKLMQKDPTFVEYFKTCHQNATPTSLSTETVEKFVCALYNVAACQDVNEARYRKFEIAYKPKKCNERFIKKFATFDSSTIPPCRQSLLEHLKRSILQTLVWVNAEKFDPLELLDPKSYGWKIDASGSYEPVWFEGPVAPPTIVDALEDDTSSDEEFSLSESSCDEDEDHDQ